MVQGKQVRLVAAGQRHSNDAYEIQAQNDVGITKQSVYPSHTSSSDNINDASVGVGHGMYRFMCFNKVFCYCLHGYSVDRLSEKRLRNTGLLVA